MRTLAPGPISQPINQPMSQRHDQGFTLIETLLAVSIMAILATVAGLGVWSNSSSRHLERDALLLSQLFVLAQTSARAWGTTIAWVPDASGFRFEPVNTHQPVLVSGTRTQATALSADVSQGSLRPRKWSGNRPVNVNIGPRGSALFTSDWMSGPQLVDLTDGLHSVRLARTVRGDYQIQR